MLSPCFPQFSSSDERGTDRTRQRRWHVAPAEIEAVLMQHSGIVDCAVVGAMAADGVTEVPRAYVVRRTTTSNSTTSPVEEKQAALLTSDEVYDFSRQRLASFKRLDGGVVFVDDIPRTASGKTQRFKLVEQGRSVKG